FTATTLLTVVGVALLMELAGLSMALGAFLAGVLLADSEYRHELEADIEPFKGLLLGLFFMAVGMTVDIGLVIETPLTVLGLALGLMLAKMLCLAAVARIDTPSWRTVRGTAIALSQGGEFAFVILALAVSSSLMDGRVADTLIVAVTLSMAATPVAFKAGDWLNARLDREPEPDYERHIEEENRVIVAGFGRVGQIVGRILRLRRIGFTALETSAEQVDFVRRFGNKVYYGDASRVELLRAARADKAVLFVLAIEDVERSLATARTVRRHFPHLTIFARARNRQHAYALMDLGIDRIVRDTFHSSLELAQGILVELGLGGSESRQTVETFRDHDTARLIAQHGIAHDTDRMIEETRHWTRELEDMFAEDEREAGETRRT
ncbi:MAG: cation:proton antiporter, partial [Defluviicoccus sp.]|nr:cation:proton antiporter [Defluviicoccus sp.]